MVDRRRLALMAGGVAMMGGVTSALPALKAYTATLAVYDPSDLTTMWQDRAGTTTQAVVGQPLGYMQNVKTGATALHMTAIASDTRRPILTNGGLYDGVDDGLSDAATSGLPASTTLIALVKTSDTTGILWSRANTALVGCWDGTAATTHFNAGSPTVKVDGVAKATRLALQTALATGTTHVVLIEGADLSAWTTLGISSYSAGGFPISGNAVPVAILNSGAGDYAAALVSASAWASELQTRLGL